MKKQPADSKAFFSGLKVLMVCVVSAFFGCSMQSETSASQAPKHRLLIRNIQILDPAAESISKPKDILLLDGRIHMIREAGKIPLEKEESPFNATGMFALPGLIDVHAHVGDGGIGKQSDQDRIDALTQFLRYGVTSIFIPGGGAGNEDYLARWKSMAASGPFPQIFGSGTIITAPDSHPIGTIWDMDSQTDPQIIYQRGAVAIHHDEDIDRLIEEKAGKKIDAIKVVIEDGPGPWTPNPRLSNTSLKKLSAAARQHNLRIFAHISIAAHLADAVETGMDGVMHSAEDRIDDATLEKMATRQMFYVPTLSLYDGFFRHALRQFELEPFAAKGISKRAIESLKDQTWRERAMDDVAWVEPTRKVLAENLRRVFAAGIPIALGTDTNNPMVHPGHSTHKELALMVASGLTPAQALTIATRGGAKFLNRETSLGQIALGYDADLLILADNPLEDIKNTQSLVAVISRGHLVENIVTNFKAQTTTQK